MNIIQRNFFHILQYGAFGEERMAEPMSSFKWKRLIQMAEAQDVMTYFVKGINAMLEKYEDRLIIDQQAINLHPTTQSDEDITDVASLSNRYLNKQLIKILETEKNDNDAQMETQSILGIIIYNIKSMLNNKLSVKGIIELGKFLRTKGDKVDFIKLGEWLRKLHLKRIAQLEGSILITDFGFEQDEIPFVEYIEKDAHKLLLKTITHTESDAAEEWHFRQGNSGFVQNNSRLMRRNIRRNARYFKYASIESISTFANNFIKSLSEIEE